MIVLIMLLVKYIRSIHIIFVLVLGSIKTHRVSSAKKDVWHTSVLITGTAKSPFSTPHISITTAPISIKCTYFMPMILHTTLEGNRSSS